MIKGTRKEEAVLPDSDMNNKALYSKFSELVNLRLCQTHTVIKAAQPKPHQLICGFLKA